MNLKQLLPFCSNRQSRDVLSRPFESGGFTVATDGRILVRVPPIEGKYGVKGHPINISNLFPVSPGEFLPLPSIPDDECVSECSGCHGTGRCIRCDCCREHFCGKCDGSGDVENMNLYLEIGGAFFALFLLQKLKLLPGPVTYWVHNKETMMFRFSGGHGLLNAMRGKKGDEA